MGGNNPWVISTLWMALYYNKLGDKKKVLECLDFVVKSSTEHGFLAEQVDNKLLKSMVKQQTKAKMLHMV